MSQSEYNGTLFRFPLRQEPSPALSSNVVSSQRIHDLFESFQADAHLVLLFLKTVEMISIYEWLPGKPAAFEVFRVCLSEPARAVVHRERESILSSISAATRADGRVKSGFVLSRCYQASITCTLRQVTITQQWLVENYISTTNPEVHSMAAKLAQIPWVGLAVPIGGKTKHGENLGRIFCFLPLPPSDDADSNSGLPVHVHGSFSVADNRRSLKWPAEDRTKDEKAEWNRLLVEQLIALAYTSLIQHAIELDRKVVSVTDIYAMWPDIEHVQYHWSLYVVPSLLSSLSKLKVLHGESTSGISWERVGDVLVCNNAGNTLSLAESVAIEEMKRIGHKVTFPATNIASCLARIESYHGVSCKRICPEVVRVELKKSNRYQNMQPCNKIQLLKYVLSDRRFDSLVGLHLLPLADRTFTSFSYRGYSAVYLESSSCPRSLFPGQDGKFLDQDIDRGVCTTLKEVATTSHTQLKNIQLSDVPPLISEVLSSVWRHGCGAVIPRPHTVNGRLTDGWLEELWGWINRNTFNIPLSKFEHMYGYIIPVTSTSGVKNLMKLAPLPALFAEVPGVDVRISKDLAKGLESLGCTVLYQPSSYLVSCSHVYNYICKPVQILTCISRAGVSSSKYQSLALAQKRELMSVVSSALQVCHPSRPEIDVLKSLPVFRVWGGQNLVSLSHCSQVAPVNLEETLPIVANLVASPNLASRLILQYFSKNINYFELTLEEVMIKFVFNQFQRYSMDAKENLIKFCLDNIYSMSSNARQTMASLAFVRTGDGQLKAPNAVFNPSERHVLELYGDQCVFAVGSFAMNSKYGELLHQYVGLRKLSDISANELYVLAERIAAKKSKSMGKTLLEVLHTQTWAQRLLSTQTYRHGWVMCSQALATVEWMPVIEHSSSIMHFGMPWASSSPTCLPGVVVVPSDDLSSERLQLTVGSQLAILDYASVISPSIVKFLSCASLSTMYEAVMKQLIVAHKLWKAKSIKESGREEFDRMLQEIFSTLGCAFSSSFATVILDGLKSAPADWVWLNGSQGFIRPEQLAVSSAFPGSLEPWLYEIGHYPHLNDCSPLLKTSGMKSKFEKEDILCVLPSMKAFYDSSTIQVEPKKMGRDLELTIAILNWLTRDGSILSRTLQQNLLVPVDRENNVLELCPCSELMYCDAEWLRRSDDLEVADYRLIHKQVSSDTAYKLGVPSLSNRLAPSEELPFEQLGPHESLTLRLKNILKEYKDDAGIFKELLQNADDAEATSVKFLVDWRQHDKFKSSLLAPGMSKCQGPALWAFNDSVFSDEDFVNISKLAAATKQSKLEKIGRFGLGFTSVYHITDVPSFVSRRYVVIFDPHESHLGNHIRNPSQPGIKIDFVQSPIGQRFPDQFQPYADVFGCNLVERAEFNGTLFRFPFRTNEQAAVNEIKKEAYDEDRVKTSLRALQEVCGKLLIFLQHVKSIEVFELKSDAVSPSDMRQIFSVQAGIDLEVSGSPLSHHGLLTSLCSQVEQGNFQRTAGCDSTCVIKWRDFGRDEVHTAKWLVCSEGSKGTAFQFSIKHGGHESGFVPFASVAVELRDECVPCVIDGETFCFLPLSERTGLPLHVNGYFAVLSNRRGIWWHGTDGKIDFEAEWNEQLITDCLVQSYLSMLKRLSKLLECREKTDGNLLHYYSLWPNQRNCRHAVWYTLVAQFYKEVVQGSDTIFCSISNDGYNWIPLSDCVILSHSVLEVLPQAQQIMKQFCPYFVELPNHVLDGLSKADDTTVKGLTVNEEKFVSQWFAPHVQEVKSELRDALLKSLLTRVLTTVNLISCLRSFSIFPCCPDGQVLRAASDMIDFKCEESELFEVDEGRFPVEFLCEREELVLALRKLGMRSTGCFTWDDVTERSATVEALAKGSYEGAKRRIGALIKLMNRLCEKDTCSATSRELLRNTPFLLVERRPNNYPVVWYGDQHPDEKVVSPAKGYSSQYRNMIGSLALIVDYFYHVRWSPAVIDLLGFNRSPPLSMLLIQLDLVINALQQVGSNRESLMKIIDTLYKELQRRYNGSEPDIVVASLTDKAWVVVQSAGLGRDKDRGRTLNCYAMKTSQLAFDWGKSAPPYLSNIPSELLHIRTLLEATGVERVFGSQTIIGALKQIFEEMGGEQLPHWLLKYVEQLILPEFNSLPPSELKTFRGVLEVPLLSEDERLMEASKLAYNDAPWMDRSLTDKHVYVHRCVPREIANDLGVKLVRDKVLDSYARDIPGREFGQHEPLTQRLQNILKEYPADEGILKELVQNADDAKATEIHIILDQRQYKKERIFTDEWKSLQGPAICVYNNRPFTDKDIEGIQNLGRGSKSDDPSLTGQYGIGFNAVYHLTDCPSFLSDNKTLCVLDPQCRYVRGATKERPGRLYDTDEKFWNQFCDIWDCYKSIDGITLEGGTLFRLPLRTVEMAKESDVSEKVFDNEHIQTLMNTFKESAPSMLLFLNNVRCIKLTFISETSKVTSSYEVKAHLSTEATEERRRMSEAVAESKGKRTGDIEYSAAFYELEIQVSEELSKFDRKRDTEIEGQWLVHHSIGVPHLDESGFSAEGCDMALLPRVGIAALIRRTLKTERANVFCFLPLPLQWNLPVQVNGHFALNSTRRGLWRDSKSSRPAKSNEQEWNEDLIKFVLAPAYAKFLVKAREYVTVNEDDDTARQSFGKRLYWFYDLLPKYTFSHTELYPPMLVKELYVYFVKHNCPLLAYTGQPAVSVHQYMKRLNETEQSQIKAILVETDDFEAAPLEWREIGNETEAGILTGYFSSFPSKYEIYALEVVLLRLGFPIVLSPRMLYTNILKANEKEKEKSTEKAKVEMINREAVYLFLKNYQASSSCCRLRLESFENTVLRSCEAANLILRYLVEHRTKSGTNSESETESDTSYLNGLPLLITADGKLREFSTSSTAFVSLYSDLLPKELHLFVHSQLVRTLQHSKDSVLKELSASDLARYLPDQGVFPSNWLNASRYYDDWNPDVGPSKQWIDRLWSYLRTVDCDEALKTLANFPIITVGKKTLVPPSLSQTVLLPKSSELFARLRQVLMRLGAVEVDGVVVKALSLSELRYSPTVSATSSSSSQTYLNRFASIDNPSSILKVLQYLYKDRDAPKPSLDEAKIILEYFQSNLSSLDASGRLYTDELKALPLFETVEGIFTEILPLQSAYTLPKELPDCGSKVWMNRAKCIFLKEQQAYARIYKKLGLSKKTGIEVYMDYILPCFSNMSQDDRIAHLVFIMTQYEDCERLIEKVTVTPCFDKNGKPVTTDEFYDPTVPLFSKMLSSDEIPPMPTAPLLAERQQPKWLPFLRRLGLKTVCPTSKFLELAKRLEVETLNWTLSGREPDNYEDWKKRSKLMEDHLTVKMRNAWSDKQFMARMSTISFLPSKQVRRKLENLATPFYKRNRTSNYATNFSNGVLYSEDNERLCWTSIALIDVENATVRGVRSNFISSAGISVHPKLDDVLTHFSLLVEQAQTVVSPSFEIAGDVVELLLTVLSTLFSYFTKLVSSKPLDELPPFADLRNVKSLSSDLSSDGYRIVEFLSSYPSIFIPDKQMFVKPQQVVFSLEHKFYPYLFQLPRDLASYHLLLRRIGVDEKPKAFHCARILESIRTRYGDDKVVSPGDWNVSLDAVALLFQILRARTKQLVEKFPTQNTSSSVNEMETSLTPLYLLSRDETLVVAKDLVYLDRVHLENQLGHFSKYKFLIDLMKCGLSSLEEETIDLLPSRLRPQKFSHLTEEVLDPDCLCLVVEDDERERERLATIYQRRLSSPIFLQGIRSIFIHQARSPRLPVELETRLSLLQSCLRVRCLPEIRICLKPQDGRDLIKLEGVQKFCFHEQTPSEVTLYIESNSTTADSDMRLHGFIAEELQTFLGTQLSSEFPLIRIVYCKHSASIPEVLKSHNIPFVNDGDLVLDDNSEIYYPGMQLLPSHLAHLHKSDLVHRFNIDEWVAYEVEEDRFIYAIVIHREYDPHAAESELMTRYGINIGEEEPKIVSVLSLYAFTDKDEFHHQLERSLVLADSSSSVDANSDIDSSATLENKKDAVQKQLNEIWKLSIEDRKKAIRRLYLKWHPDKTDDPDAAEVFKFMKIEIARLERGDPQYGGVSSYSGCYSNWDSFARSYGRSYRASSYTYRRPPCYSYLHLVRDQRLGLLFVRQAEADFKVAEALFGTDNSDDQRFATVCFLCHEAVEKALKGLLYMKRGIPDEDRHKHYFRFFLGAADLPGCPSTLKGFVYMVSDDHYLDTRYPNKHYVVPADQFSRDTANRSLTGARGVIKDTLKFAEDNS